MGKHPFDGQGLDYGRRIRFWDDYSDHYSAFQQGDIPERIIDRLLDIGMLLPSDCVLEVGSGPGTYSIPLASKVRILTCMDSSTRMLDRLMGSARARGLPNIERFDKDWNDYVPRKGYDFCIATLCPGTGSPVSMTRMEGAARRGCALVSWLENHGDDLNQEVWRRLGEDYGYEARQSTAAHDWLSGNGRDPITEVFTTTVEADIPIEDLVTKEASAFAAYGTGIDAETIIREILEPMSDNGIVHYRATNRMKLTYWHSP